MALTLITAPASEPVTLVETKLHLRVDVDADDDLITALIQSAREYVEMVTRRALITQTWDYHADKFPSSREIALTYPPLQSVTGVYYTPLGEAEQTFAPASYVVDVHGTPGRLLLADGASWPGDTLVEANGVRVQFVAGYGDAVDDVPRVVRQAVLLMVGHLYENREATAGVGNVREIPIGVAALLWTYRVLMF